LGCNPVCRSVGNLPPDGDVDQYLSVAYDSHLESVVVSVANQILRCVADMRG